jgi:Glycosyltransferase family 87
MIKHARPPVWQVSLLAVIPTVWIAWATVFATSGPRHWSVSDFLTFRAAASALLHGRSPYPHLDPSVLAIGHSFVYPPIAAYPFIPFTVLPAHVAIVSYLVASLAAIAAALWIIGVRDWRVLGVVLLWQPVLMWLIEGPIEPWMLLLLALGWRWRTYAFRVAAIVALLVSLKLFLWPLLVWLLATRRYRAFLASVAMSAAFTLLPFASVGIHALRIYPQLLRTLTNVYGASSFSLLAVFESVMSSHRAEMATLGGALALIGLIGFVAAREDGDRRAFSVAIVGAVMLSPIVWAHYFLLLAAPIALARPRLSLLWFAPLLFWPTGAAALAQPHRLVLGVLIPLVVLVTVWRRPATDRKDEADMRHPLGASSLVQSTGSGSGSVRPAMR